MTVNGSGCPAGTAAVAVSPDNTAFTVAYSSYMAQVGVGAKPTDVRKNCQLNLRVHVPQGFTYAVAKADYRGFAHLERGASALERANYYFQGSSATAYVSHPLKGPFNDDWQATDEVDVASLVWAPCGEKRNLNVNTELRVSVGTSNPNLSRVLRVRACSTPGNCQSGCAGTSRRRSSAQANRPAGMMSQAEKSRYPSTAAAAGPCAAPAATSDASRLASMTPMPPGVTGIWRTNWTIT